MKRLFFIILTIIFISCNRNEKKPDNTTASQIITDSTENLKPLNIYNPESKLYVWKSSFDYTKSKNHELVPEILNADSLIKGLNELNENIVLEKIKISGDTIYTEVKDSEYLTEAIGTTGAEMYLADVVLNLTEVAGIKFVNINLKEGSHMQPGTWSKDNFSKYKPVN
jgi:hypothetical protein